MEENKTMTNRDMTPQKPATVVVPARFTPEELEKMKRDTGALNDATAVSCFCRKRLHVMA